MSPVRWLRAVAVISATALLMASSCSWQLGHPIPEGVPPPGGRSGARRSTPTPRAGPPTSCTSGRPSARPRWASRSTRWRPTPTRRGSPRWRTPTATWPGRRWPASAWWRATTAPIAARPSRPNGDVTPPIRGVRLDGTNGNLEIVDNDGGRARRRPGLRPRDGADAVHPGDLAALRRRRQQRRRRQPDNFDDAALSAAGYLCWRGKDLATPRGWMDALRAYNHSDQYARTVRDWATAYANGHPL